VRLDSVRAPRDTIKAQLAAAEAPTLADPSGSFVWDRRDMFSTGALTVQDLLDRMPGATGLRSGWISQPMVTSFLGDPGRVRVFLDGLELRELDPRMEGRMWDLTQIPLWALDDLRVERGASEIRIHMRSWRVDRTTPFTRTDVYTGDQATNLYRGLFGRRYQHGEALQLAGQQFGTNPGRLIESSDQLGVLARVGMARDQWSADALLLRGDRNRGRTFTETFNDTIPSTESTRTDAYFRFGWGTAEKGPWVQTIASTSKYAFGGKGAAGTGGAAPVSSDTSRSELQYLLTGGYTRGPMHFSFAQRFRAGLRRRIATPLARASWETRLLTVSALAEGRGIDSTRRFEVSSVLRPVGFIFLAGAAGAEQPRSVDTLQSPGLTPTPRFLRGEAGLRVRDFWVSGGLLRRDAVELDAPRIFRPETESVIDPALQGVFMTVRGRLWKAVHADVQAMQWSDTGWYYRPRHQVRSELYVSTSLLERFPSGNFHFLGSAVHEYRSSSLWPDATAPIRLTGYRTISTLIQVRILQAEVFWNFRNVLGERYQHIPGYRLPRLSNIYGVRWEFWN